MTVRYPLPLRPGDRVGVTSPSSGVDLRLRPRLDVAVRTVEAHGYEVVVGSCMDGSRHVSAPALKRAEELTAMLADPTIRAIVPPWGGETAIDLLPLLDWEVIRAAEPTWVIGFSDMSTVITPLTLLTGIATLHGNNLMDTPYEVPDGLVGWLDVVTKGSGESFTQTSPNRHRSSGWVDYAEHPEDSRLALDAEGRWVRLDSNDPVAVEGRLVGGCVETLSNLMGTPYGDVASFAREHAPEGLLVYVEASADEALEICRNLHGMRLAGFFDAANAVLVGRTSAKDSATLTQEEAVLDALGGLGVPIIADVECGHVPPHLPLVNGALGRITWSPDGSGNALTQTLA
jgi:muramoyltetrapeptide carboxypeptidase LdcA involved in peptidoglycan recycling